MVNVLVVLAMVGSPVECGILECRGTEDQGEKFDRLARFEGFVSKEAMIAEGDTHPCGDEVGDEKNDQEGIKSEMIKIQRSSNHSCQERDNQEPAGEPVDSIKWNVGEHNVVVVRPFQGLRFRRESLRIFCVELTRFAMLAEKPPLVKGGVKS